MVDSADEELIPAGPWLEFHNDTCLPPPAATVLARNDAGVQAFRLGRHLALQFHPEVDGPQLKRWLDAAGPTDAVALGIDPGQFLADTIREEPSARERAERLVSIATHSQVLAHTATTSLPHSVALSGIVDYSRRYVIRTRRLAAPTA